MKKIALTTFLILSSTASAFASEMNNKQIYKIYPNNNDNYFDRDLKKRIWELERAVEQLQMEVFRLQNSDNNSAPKTWVCSSRGFETSYTASSSTKADATSKAMEKCRKLERDAFFCKLSSCDNG